jgi:hypothetical protein
MGSVIYRCKCSRIFGYQCGLEELKTKALEEIRSQLSKENIVIELQSTLTSTYVF